MTKTDRVQVRIAPDTKQRADELFDSLGFNMSRAITLFINQSLRVGGFPFDVEGETAETVNKKQLKSSKRA